MADALWNPYDDMHQRRREAQEAASAEHFATSDAIPDLEFLTPECSICTRPTVFDDGSFECEVCRVVWRSTGYGHEAERYDP